MAEIATPPTLSVVNVSHPVFKVMYEQKDITHDISPFLLSVTYSDYTGEQSDELSISVEDSDGRWIDKWYPGKGDKLLLEFGYENQPLVQTQAFEIEEIEISGKPSVVNIKALAAGIKRSVRTLNGRAYENTTLSKIAQKIAKHNYLHLVGKIRDIYIDRITQYHERDLSFLARVAKEYGYIFKVIGERLVFSEIKEQHHTSAVFHVTRPQLKSYRFSDKIKDIVAMVQITYHDPKTKRKIHKMVPARHADTSVDQLNIVTRAHNSTIAETKANAALHRANLEQTSGSLTMIGNPKALAGNNIQVDGFGKLNGKYTIQQSRHKMDRGSGYETEIEIKRILL